MIENAKAAHTELPLKKRRGFKGPYKINQMSAVADCTSSTVRSDRWLHCHMISSGFISVSESSETTQYNARTVIETRLRPGRLL